MRHFEKIPVRRSVGKASVFAPAHMTGFFALGSGTSYGAGMTLDKGMRTVCISSRSRQVSYYLKNRKTSAASVKVSSLTVRKYIALFPGYFKDFGLIVKHYPDFPIGFGLGMSACAALSLSLALNKLLGMPLSRKQAVEIAAKADFECKCGVLGVAASDMGGFLAKRTPKSRIIKLKIPANCKVLIGFLSPINTSKVLQDKTMLRRLGIAGKRAAKAFFKKPGIYVLTHASNLFALESGIAKGKTKKYMTADRFSGMAMLGNTLFWVFPDNQSALLAKKYYARLFKKMVICEPSETGAVLI